MTDDDRQQDYWEGGTRWRLRPPDHPVVRFFAEQRVTEFAKHLDFGSIRNALDVGCGDGASTLEMMKRIPEVWAVDRSEAMLARHPLRDTDRVKTGEVYALPFEDGRFDLVYAWEVLHHVEDPARAVAEMARISSGYVLLAEPNPLNPAQFAFAVIDRDHRWVLRFRMPFMKRLIADSGLEVVHAAAGGWIFPNQTPSWLMSVVGRLPYRFPVGITNWVLARKPREPGAR